MISQALQIQAKIIFGILVIDLVFLESRSSYLGVLLLRKEKFLNILIIVQVQMVKSEF